MAEQIVPHIDESAINIEIVDTFLDSPEKLTTGEFIDAVVTGWMGVAESKPSILADIIQADAKNRLSSDPDDTPQRKILRDILNRAPFLEKYEDLMNDPGSAEMLDFMQAHKHDENFSALRKATMSLIELWAEQLVQRGDTSKIRSVFEKMIGA